MEVIDQPAKALAAQTTHQHAPVTLQPAADQPPRAMTLASIDAGGLLQIAVQRGDGIDVLTKLMDLRDREQARLALEAFNAAFAAFKAEAVTLIRNKLIADGPLKGKKHAELSDAVNAATPALSRHGLSVSWKLTKDERDWLEVTCTLRHVAGHSESVSMGGAPDTGPGRNAIQARGSVKTYLERYTYTAILGLAAQDADDDGAGGAQETTMAQNALLARLIGDAEAATTDAEAAAFWRSNAGQLKDWPYGFEKFKKAVAAHRDALRQKGGAA